MKVKEIKLKKNRKKRADLIYILNRAGLKQIDIAKKLGVTPVWVNIVLSGRRNSPRVEGYIRGLNVK